MCISHHRYAAADKQPGRLGGFEIGNTVFHITMSPDEGTIRKSLENAKAGMPAYVLAPSEKRLLASELAKEADSNCEKKGEHVRRRTIFGSESGRAVAKFDKKSIFDATFLFVGEVQGSCRRVRR